MMKAVFVFALLVLCACGKTTTSRDVFNPKPLNCSFYVRYDMDDGTYLGKVAGFYSGYGYHRRFHAVYTSLDRKEDTLLRADIHGADETQFLYATTSAGVCNSEQFVSNTTKIGTISTLVENPFSYSGTVPGEWYGEACTVYLDGNMKYYVKDGRLIGFRNEWNEQTINLYYADVAYQEDFSFKREEFKNCNSKIYDAVARIDGCPLLEEKPIFVPLPLPCAYTVEFKAKHAEEPSNVKGYEVGYGDYLAYYNEYKINGFKVQGGTIQRIDIHDGGKETSAEVYEFYKAAGTYTCKPRSNDPYDQHLDRISEFHYYLVNEIEYKSKKEGVTYDGMICDELIGYDGVTYYTKDGHVVGVKGWESYYGEQTEVSYTFTAYNDYAYEGDFKIPKSYSNTDCSDSPNAFKVPEQVNNCTLLSGNRPGSSASTVKAFFILVMATVISTLLF